MNCPVAARCAVKTWGSGRLPPLEPPGLINRLGEVSQSRNRKTMYRNVEHEDLTSLGEKRRHGSSGEEKLPESLRVEWALNWRRTGAQETEVVT